MTTLYEKRGRRYYPVHDTLACDGLGLGSWIITVFKTDGCTTSHCRKLIEPDFARILAVMPLLRESMISTMYKRNKINRPAKRALTPKEKRAWKAYCDVMGDDAPMAFEGVSMGDVVDAGIEVLEKELCKIKGS